MNNLLFINWNPDLVFLHLGSFSLRWYSMCWLLGLLGAFFMVRHLYRQQNIKDELFEPLFLYCFVGILIGARLGHCLFYEPQYYLGSGTHFLEMFLPMHYREGSGWQFTGYEGLASHGGAIGLTIALLLYCRKTKLSVWTVLDNIAIATPITACLIRLGNLMNSEIVGKVTDVPWAFIFERLDDGLPRHPGQLYEAIAYFCFFFIGLAFYQNSRKNSAPTTQHSALKTQNSKLKTQNSKLKTPKVGTGFYFGLCITLIFTFRFFIEYTKEVQEAFEQTMPLNMGQLLSLPFIILGLTCMLKAKNKTSK